jgi:hypothetical protein
LIDNGKKIENERRKKEGLPPLEEESHEEK